MSDDFPDLTTLPAAWKGAELFSRGDWLHDLADVERRELDAAVQHTATAGIPVESITAADFPLQRLGERLRQIQSDLEQASGACLIRGLTVEGYSEDEQSRLFFGIACHLGTPLSQSAAGEKVFSVRDEGHEIGNPQARGPNTRRRLSFHTDRCDVIAFLCLRQAKSGGENQLLSSVTLYNQLRRHHPELLRVLMQPYYYARHNVDTGNRQPWCRQPIVSFTQGHFACSYLRVLIDRAYALPELPEMTEEQFQALHVLEELAADPSFHVTFLQQPGDLLLLNNWVTLHRRNEFEDDDDPVLRRHILRIWLAMPNSRPIDPLFQDNYGATGAGAIRGGMQPST